MDLFLLPGNSQHNREWIRQAELVLAPLFTRTRYHTYAHWENNKPEIDLDHEIKQLAEATKGLSPYVTFAKSAGAILAIKAAAESVLQPKSCLFVGFPLAMIINHNLPVAEWLRATEFPIVILQHGADPLGSYQDVKQYFSDIGRGNVTIHELPGNSHDYLEFQTFKDFAKKLH